MNSYKASPLVDDPQDAEHNEYWPGGRVNHYWFDLNRDVLLGIHPETRGKLNFHHSWYPNVTMDFHEMGTNSTYFLFHGRLTLQKIQSYLKKIMNILRHFLVNTFQKVSMK
ncbi:MAG: hypothetical protein CM15mP102_06800 [Flavobacteriales bacterium]|nr:MAG: hypothetical protein CM15mP102_06800 [Flavobacteriales bacterium]